MTLLLSFMQMTVDIALVVYNTETLKWMRSLMVTISCSHR